MNSESATDERIVDFSDRKKQGPLPSVLELQHSFDDHHASCDTPLRMYVQRTLQSRITTPLLHSRYRWNPQDQVSLSQLALDNLSGSNGKEFQSTTRVRCAPLPFAFNQHPYTPRNTRKVVSTTERYNPLLTPAPPIPSGAVYRTRQRRKPKQIISWKPELPSPRLNHQESELALDRSRYLMASRDNLPHRLNHNFYMKSKCVTLKDREVMPTADMLALPSLEAPLAHKASLLYGTGIKPVNGRTTRKALQRFAEKLNFEDRSNAMRSFGKKEDAEVIDSGSSSESFISQLDVGRYSRLSRAMTPGTPILEEIDEEEGT